MSVVAGTRTFSLSARAVKAEGWWACCGHTNGDGNGNPLAAPRATGKPHVLERAWMGGSGFGGATAVLGSHVDRLGAVSYAVDAAGAALADAGFVELRV